MLTSAPPALYLRTRSPTGRCPCPCDYARDPGCTCRDLTSPMRVALTKSRMWASYPLQFLQSFNYKPYEVVLRPSNKQCKVGVGTGVQLLAWRGSGQGKVTVASHSTSCQAHTRHPHPHAAPNPAPLNMQPDPTHMQAGDFEPSPTCGWYWVRGQQVPDSQGFSCECTSGQVWEDTLGGNNERT